MSKGSNRRPLQVPDEKFQENWERIFGPKSDWFVEYEKRAAEKINKKFENLEWVNDE